MNAPASPQETRPAPDGFDRGPRRVRVLLCDADDNLFASEAPAYEASVEVVNRLMQEIGSSRRFDAQELRRSRTGVNFRTLARELAGEEGAPLPDAELERWVAEERRAVCDHLGDVLTPDHEVLEVLEQLAALYELAVVSSSALVRLDVCLNVTGLASLLPEERRFSAEDSLRQPTSKPDPAVYRFACEHLDVDPEQAIAIEDSPTGVRSAVGAGLRAIGNVRFVVPAEREERERELRDAGASDVVDSWAGLEALLEPASARAAPDRMAGRDI
jgi:beta-phosphoglucomutase-like phosphatase (HAD superfamily)